MRQDHSDSARRSEAAARSRRLAPIVGGLCLAQALSGCILGSEKPELAIDVPDQYRTAHGAPEAAAPALDWWRGFRSRELTSLIEDAQKGNFDIAVAVAQILQADAQVRISGAPLFPTLDYNASAATSRASTATGSGASAGGGSPTSNLFSNSLTASYVLDFWGKNRATLLAAEENATVSRYNRAVVTLTTVTTVANTYFQILAAQDRLQIARRNVVAASHILDLIRQQFNAGTVSEVNVAQQESLVATVQATIPPLEQTLRQNVAALAVLVGRAPEHFDARGGSMSRIATPRVTPGLPSQLLGQRPDVRQAEEQLASANFSVEAARAAFFPTIQLTGQMGFQSAALKTLFGPGAWFYTTAASLAQPLFDGFLLQGQLELQKGLQTQFVQAYRKAVISAFADVEKALIAVQETALQERDQANVVRTARRAFDLSEQQLGQGTVNLVTLLQIEQTLFQAEDTLAQVQLARLQAAVGLFQALGGGWPPLAYRGTS